MLLLIVVCGCGDVGDPADRKALIAEDDKGRLVRVSKVARTSSNDWIEYVGELRACRKVDVGCEVGGLVEKLYFEKGNRIKKSGRLADVGTKSRRLEVMQARAVLEEAKAVLLASENDYKRTCRLYKIKAVSESKFDLAEKLVNMSRAKAKQVAASLALAEDRFKKSRVCSPLDGIIAYRDIEEGEIILAGQTITEVIDLSRIKIEIDVGEREVGLLKTKKNIPFMIDAVPDETFISKLSFVSPSADAKTRSFMVELIIDTPDLRMADGMTARVNLPASDKKKVMKVPSDWLAEENSRIGLYVAEDGRALFRAVKLGAYYDRRVEILSGLSDQDIVITTPAGLKSGDKIYSKD